MVLTSDTISMKFKVSSIILRTFWTTLIQAARPEEEKEEFILHYKQHSIRAYKTPCWKSN